MRQELRSYRAEVVGSVYLDYGPISPIPGVFLTLIGVLMIGAGLYRLLDRKS